MAKYGKKSQEKVERAMHEMKEGTLKSGRSGKKVTNPKQAVAIGLSEAREEGGKVPKKAGTATRKKAAAKPGPKKSTAKQSTAKSGTKKTTAKKAASKPGPKKGTTRKSAAKSSTKKKATAKKATRKKAAAAS